MNNKVLVVGSTGLVGGYLMSRLSGDTSLELLGTTRTPRKMSNRTAFLSLQDKESIDACLQDFGFPFTVILCAAQSDVDLCELAEAYKVNVLGTEYLVNRVNRYGGRVIFLSSSYVFSGESTNALDELPMPVQSFGQQKQKIERVVLSNPQGIVVRTVGVFGLEEKRKNFVYRVVDALVSKNKVVFASDDESLNPIHAHYLAKRISDLVTIPFSECLYHVGGDTALSKYEFAVRVADAFGLDTARILRGQNNVSQVGRARRPKNGCVFDPNPSNNFSFDDSLALVKYEFSKNRRKNRK